MSIRFAAVGLSHPHIYNQIDAFTGSGAELAAVWGVEPERLAEFTRRFPHVKVARDVREILDDPTIALVASAAVPNERAPLGVQVMQHGKDYSCAKPGFVSLEQLAEARRVQAETKRIYAIHFGERFDNAATVRAGELAHSGAIGRVVQTVGLGPHRFLGHIPRPEWAFDTRYFGGILNDLSSHQIDQFLFFTGSETAEIVQAQVGNVQHRQFANFEDFGDLNIRSERAIGYIRVDWLTPPGLDTWGDVRLFVIGTHGYIEVRKNTDLAGRTGKDHVFIVDQNATRYVDCAGVALPYGGQLMADVLHRTETAMRQDLWFHVSELALIAQQKATRLHFE